MQILKILFFGCLLSFQGVSQEIPTHKVIPVEELYGYLNRDVRNDLGHNDTAELAKYFREKFSQRYFYDWQNFPERFETYKRLYPEQEALHQERALDHTTKFKSATSWVLPFTYENGGSVDAYAIRHLARQHRMVDVAFHHYYNKGESGGVDYFTTQMQSLNQALDKGAYEKIEDGNGVYEAFRSGYRILNWLWIHNMFLSDNNYSDEEQLYTIATLLQHGSHLYNTNKEFRPGNHQTRGMSALAMLSIILRDFVDTDLWYERSMKILEQHLEAEINDDGFQFERTVHYHISDIGNYYYVYQLAQISNIDVSDTWEQKINSLFTTLGKIAYPDKSAPVLQDDTDQPWAELNNIAPTMTLGYVLLNDPEIGFFAGEKVESKMYWFLSEQQLSLLENVEKETPSIGSIDFKNTGYFIMREGWNNKDKMMIISAGLDEEKPDHQHGDMLGIQAMANGKPVLPNYQVRYYLKDLELFKNSLVKNVALVDDELQGKEYTSNQGGSGFGKFRKLPEPSVITWNTNDNLDLFVGSHNGFEDIGVAYTRQVIYIKDDFWIVKDNFNGNKAHDYKQIWQGHYTNEHAPNLLRASFDNGSGFDIYQLRAIDKITSSGSRGKQWSVAVKEKVKDFSFITILFPFSKYSDRLKEEGDIEALGNWKLNTSVWKYEGRDPIALSKTTHDYFLSVNKFSLKELTVEIDNLGDFYVKREGEKILIQSLNVQDVILKFHGANKCGEEGDPNSFQITLAPGETTNCLWAK